MSEKLIGNSPLKIKFTSKMMTAYGGFTLLSRLFEKLDLQSAIETMVPFCETSPNGTGVYAKILKLGLTVAAGGYRYTHSAFLGDSTEIYELSFGVPRIPKSITSVTRFFNQFKSWQTTENFSDKMWEYVFARVIPTKLLSDEVLTFDSTVITRYGNQEGSCKGYNPRKRGRKSHHPIFAFLNKSRYVVNLWNRSGNSASGNGIVDFCKQTQERLSGKVNVTMILADSGFYNPKFMDHNEASKISYIIAAPMMHVLQNEIYKIDAWREVDDGICVSQFYFKHDKNTWKEPRRYIVVRKKVSQTGSETIGKQLTFFPEEDEKVFAYKYGLYITSSVRAEEDLWREYRLRANDENIIKENKEDFGLEGFSQKSFYATEAAMLVRILFYNILNLFKSQILPEAESKLRVQTLRSKYFVIPALLGRDGKNPILRLGVRKQNVRTKFLYILSRINIYFTNCIAFEHTTAPP